MPMSELVALRTVLETYRTGSISRAARRLGITQSTASTHVQSLEAALGRALFTRTARGVAPTALAHDLASATGGEVDRVEGALAQLKARSALIGGAIALAGPAEFVSERVLPCLADLMERGLRVRLHVGNRDRIYGLLRDGVVDVAVTASQPADRALAHAEIARERLVLVASPAFARAHALETPSAAELTRLSCLAYDQDAPLVREFFRHRFAAPPPGDLHATLPDLRMILRMATDGAGWTVLPDYLCADAVRAGMLVLLAPANAGPENALNLVWTKSALREPRVAFVKDAILNRLRDVPGT
jgi:DNA-binding transcriptional LysR family regulator